MYAIIEDGGRQFKVQEGQELQLDYRDLSSGTEVTFERVLAYRDEKGLRVGQPTLQGVKVVGEVLGVAQGPKLYVQEFRRRKTYRKRTGHRQLYTRVKVTKISLPATTEESESTNP